MKRGIAFGTKIGTTSWCEAMSAANHQYCDRKHSLWDEGRVIDGPDQGRDGSVTGCGERWRDGRAATNADQVDFTERRMWAGAPLQKLVVATILIGDKVRVQRVVLAVIKRNTHERANRYRRNGAITGQMLAELVFRYDDMNRRCGLRAL